MKNIVVIGGGTGTFTVLRGLKKYNHNITAIVTMFDSGGSSGVLRDEHGILPPGDVRRCLVALSEGENEKTMRELFNYRFQNGGSLKGHSFGNILLTALTEILGREDKAINEAGKLLNIKGSVLPVSLDNAQLCVELSDGTIIEGEEDIDIPKHDGSLRINKAFLRPDTNTTEDVLKAIALADVIVIGPGDFYTSIIPNMLVGGVADAIKKSKAKKVLILNLFTKWGETHNFKASDYARIALKYMNMEFFDYIICNNREMPKKMLDKYEKEKKYAIGIDAHLYKYARKIIREDLCRSDHLLRHDSGKISKIIDSLT